MILEQIGEVLLPAHDKPGGFDHAAVHGPRGRLYVAHTANDGLDVVDCATNTYLGSIPRLGGVAGALVSEAHDLVFTSNRAENTVGIFAPDREEALIKVKVGLGPNGLAYDAGRHLLLARAMIADVDVEAPRLPVEDCPAGSAGDWETGCFYVNIGDPPQIAVIEAANPSVVARTFAVPAAGPHGLDLDGATQRLFCACDGKILVVLDSRSGAELARAALAGVPDVIFFNRERRHLYVAIGEPGLIEVFETDQMRRLETVRTEAGAHTLGFDPSRHTVYAFLPGTHRALVYMDRG